MYTPKAITSEAELDMRVHKLSDRDNLEGTKPILGIVDNWSQEYIWLSNITYKYMDEGY